MSSRRGTELLDEIADDRPGVARAWACLWMELRRARALGREVERLDSAVVERHVRRLPRLRRLDREAVVLRRHEHAAACPLEHRMVRAAVTERQLERLHPDRKPEQLVTQADPQHRHAAEQLA